MEDEEARYSRRLRRTLRRRYEDDGISDEDIEGKRTFDLEEKLRSPKYNSNFIIYMEGKDFNMRYVQQCGLRDPLIFKSSEGLGIRMPDPTFTVNDVKLFVGSKRIVDVMDVGTQKGIEMTMAQWAKYYETPEEERQRLYNVISLEFSHTKLENLVQRPATVDQIDWVDNFWPRHLKDRQTESTNAIQEMQYPKVQKYCLMSVRGCYTDFHVDFGGTSVWYHILRGGKVFWLIPPTDQNLEMYENWLLSGKQGDIFLGDKVEDCQRVELKQGYTFVIPSGWIHAVYTPQDTLVFGGNFLHSFNIPMQLRIYSSEDRTRVPTKFRYPFYYEMCWYVLERYVYCMTRRSHLTKDFQRESLSIDLELNGRRRPDTPSSSSSSSSTSSSSSASDSSSSSSSPSSSSSEYDDSSDQDWEEEEGLSKKERERRRAEREIQRRRERERRQRERSRQRREERLRMARIPAAHRPPTPPPSLPTPPSPSSVPHCLTWFEVEGLHCLVTKLESLPPQKKCLPDGIYDADALIADIKKLLEEHAQDPPELALTGVPIVQWRKRQQYKVHLRPKIQFTKPHIMRPAARHATSAPRPVATYSGSAASSGARRRRVRCRKCQACLQRECGTCHYCKDMKKFGGPGRMKQSCMQRQCLALSIYSRGEPLGSCSDEVSDYGRLFLQPRLPHSVTCAVCGEVDQTSDSHDFEKKLMECSTCNEIVHPGCLEMDGEGLLSEELPNYWECPKCYERKKHTGNTDQEKVLLHNKRKAVDNCDLDHHLSAKVLRPPLGQSPPSPPLLLLPPSPSSGPPTPPATTPQAIHVSREERAKRRQLTREKENHPSGREHSEADRAWHRSSYLTVTLQRPPKELSSSSIVPKLQAITSNSRHSFRPSPPEPPDEDEEDEDEEDDEDEDDENGLLPGQHKDDPSMQKDVWLSVFHYLTQKEICVCMRVCKAWYKWGGDKRLWSRIVMSRCKSLMPQALSGIIRRQPVQLDLSWTNVSKKQLTWLVNRLPGLKELILSGCSWSAVSALSSPSCPLLRTLDLRWGVGMKDAQIRDLLTPPTEKPGHDSRSKLRFLTDLRLSGLDISDVTLRLIIRHCPVLSKLDLSHCPLLTDQSVNLLTAVGSSTRGSLAHIHLSGCKGITDESLLYLRRAPNLTLIDLRACKQVTRGACESFISDLSVSTLYCQSAEKLIQKIS
ncbi:lysine-specific demethylase 2A isoform X2 [Engystomops pustulosus]|uniref:lysine-specific demethylase 2A isoform X2 n=1 Tax=Engystomops pustulosus TaxID=76066 RepID=UPI003AFAD8FB